MKVEIIHKHKPLRSLSHDGQTYLSAPKKGTYTIRLQNDSTVRRLAVVTVDGVNVIDGKDGEYKGTGYVLNPFETVDIPGWKRDGGEAAAFVFRPEEASYAAQTGRGTRNVGVIGVAVFEEKVQAPTVTITTCGCSHHHYHHYPDRWYTRGGYVPSRTTIIYGANTGSSTGGTNSSTLCTNDSMPLSSGTFTASNMPSASSILRNKKSKGVIHARGLGSEGESEENTAGQVFFSASADVGTGYGHAVDFQTTTTNFERATETPASIIVLRYATLERLKSWGLPVEQLSRSTRFEQPQAFPSSSGTSVPAPPGWRG